MIDVCFAGITGWTAPAIVAAIAQADDLTLSSGVSRSAAGQSLAAAAGSASHGYVYATVAEALQSAPADVLIDYTSAAAVKTNVWTAVRAGVHRRCSLGQLRSAASFPPPYQTDPSSLVVSPGRATEYPVT